MSTITPTQPERVSGRHPVNVGHLVMGIAFLGLVGVWALIQSDMVGGSDVRWLLPVPWVLAGLAGLLAIGLSGSRRWSTRQTGWANDTPAGPHRAPTHDRHNHRHHHRHHGPGDRRGEPMNTSTSRRLIRRSDDRMIAGVCSGVADYLGLDPTLVRLLAVVAAIFSVGAVAVAYIAAWILMPEA